MEKEMSWCSKFLTATIAWLSKSRKPCLNLCFRRWFIPTISLVSNLALFVLWHRKTLLPEARMNFKRHFFWKYSNFLSYIYFDKLAPFNNHKDRKKGFQKILFYFERRNIISLKCNISLKYLILLKISIRKTSLWQYLGSYFNI